MGAAGIICEYNPFHNGHAYHIRKTRELTRCSGVVCIMSGNFVQRGDCAVYDKHLRAHMALLGGADLVLELPFCYSAQSARYFAQGAVELAERTGIIDTLSFGSEAGELAPLQKAAKALEQEKNSPQIKENLRLGKSYPAARAHLMEKELGSGQTSAPNNILAVEYLYALSRLHSSIQPVTIRRLGEGYHSKGEKAGFMSASGIRRAMEEGKLDKIREQTPASVCSLLPAPTYHLHHWDSFLLGLIRRMQAEELAAYPYLSEGLENRIYTYARQAYSIESLLALVKTKRYTYTRLARSLINLAVGITKAELETFIQKGPAYLRILAANRTGTALIKKMREKSSLPILTKPAHYRTLSPYAQAMFELELRADDLFSLCCDEKEKRMGGQGLLRNPIIL